MKTIRTVPKLLFILLLLALVLPGRTGAAPTLPLAGQTGGANNDIIVGQDGRYAYLASGPRILVIGLADPMRPSVDFTTPLQPGVIRKLTLAGDRLYAVAENELTVFNAASPPALRLLGRWVSSTLDARDIAVSGDYA